MNTDSEPAKWIADLLTLSFPQADSTTIAEAVALIHGDAVAAGERGEVDWSGRVGREASRILTPRTSPSRFT